MTFTEDSNDPLSADEAVHGGVNNIGDQKPDRGLSDYPVGPQGRYFYLGATANFASLGSLLRNPF